jgi:hypothetical protein
VTLRFTAYDVELQYSTLLECKVISCRYAMYCIITISCVAHPMLQLRFTGAQFAKGCSTICENISNQDSAGYICYLEYAHFKNVTRSLLIDTSVGLMLHLSFGVSIVVK